ncbi:MAG: hypothetical protein CV087_08705 [Candidatus Brocadia sp. WS118]|nr:MAG: hypothetical protein CV087_08705 [Candidatus Brocadia sp. WS118]
MKTVITTVGTSLFTNYMREEVQKAFHAAGVRYEPIKENHDKLLDIPVSEYNQPKWRGRITNIERVVKENWFVGIEKQDHNLWKRSDGSFNQHASSEITSILKIYQTTLPANSKQQLWSDAGEELEIILIATDTTLSYLAANMIKESFIHPGIRFGEPKFIPGLQVANFRDFENTGFFALIDAIKSIIKITRKNRQRQEVVLNISGGYKAIIPILTIIGQLYDVPLYYVYEESDELITLSRLPIHFDWSLVEQFYPYLQMNINENYATLSQVDVEVLEELVPLQLYKKVNGSYKITALGQLFRDFIDEESPAAANTLGFFVEYKLYEYFHLHLYKDSQGKQYHIVKRGEKVKYGSDDSDIDLLLKSDDKQGSPFIIVESKSYLRLLLHIGKTLERLKAQIRILKGLQMQPEEYVLITYKTQHYSASKLKENFQKIKALLQAEFQDECLFKAYFIDIEMKLRSKRFYMNPYQRFLDAPLAHLKPVDL